MTQCHNNSKSQREAFNFRKGRIDAATKSWIEVLRFVSSIDETKFPLKDDLWSFEKSICRLVNTNGERNNLMILLFIVETFHYSFGYLPGDLCSNILDNSLHQFKLIQSTIDKNLFEQQSLIQDRKLVEHKLYNDFSETDKTLSSKLMFRNRVLSLIE